MAAVQIISQELTAVGIKVSPTFPSVTPGPPTWPSGTYDMAMDNNAGPAPPRGATSTASTSCRSASAADGPAQLGALQLTPPPGPWCSRPAPRPSPTRPAEHDLQQLEKDFLAEAARDPAVVQRRLVPGQRPYWTGLPVRTSRSDQNIPVMWGGYLGAMTTVYALAALAPARRQVVTRTAIPNRYRQLDGSMRPVSGPSGR